MKANSTRALAVPSLLLLAFAAGCGGGSGSAANGTTPTGGSGGSVTPATGPTTTGVYKGTITSTTTGQTTPVMAMVDAHGQANWMSTDGRVWTGTMPMTGAHFDASLMGQMYTGTTFPDGSTAGNGMMSVDNASGHMSGRFNGSGDAGNFDLILNSMWNRPASLPAVAGVYTRSSWTGYAMTMTIGTNGQLMANDSRGCSINGTVTIPDAIHNLYSITATVTSCGSLDGAYQGHGTLLDADAMRDWMSAMHPLEHGGHWQGNMDMTGMGHMGGMGGMPYNTVPTGTSNLFMFVLKNGQNAMMDALAK
jgi:hypothetical protein